ncbi:L-ribulose-5-phosphate 3-epimerase [Lactiplantibacillus pingfangensis]|uniref:L-ribulose-5-phosphate 3-epimerase n=1 Tax=Lactiplantibacillus pingfangensis TaxID=2559915 RepID=UPI0010F5B5A6|nr:L-ribulose-5-phosphate 3-epimerase [Lactiplantibacillus pingfangensis]
MLGIYEKALPHQMDWNQKLKLAKGLGFDFVEMSVDESDERLARLDWDNDEIESVHQAIISNDLPILSMCLSGHRRFPLGSHQLKNRQTALTMMLKAIKLASRLGIRNIQLAGYDVYYEDKSPLTRQLFIQNLTKCVKMAEKYEVMLSIEIMDDPFINSISKVQHIKTLIHSPWLQAYPDIGNLSAWPENDVGYELEHGIDNIAAVHLKDTLPVHGDFPGKFKNVPFGEGTVDFVGCLRTLKSLGYNGPYMIEMWSEMSSDPVGEIKVAKQFIDKAFTNAEAEVDEHA